MGDIFHEQLVKRKASLKTTTLKALIIAAALIVSILSVMWLGAFGPVLALAAVYGAYYVYGFTNVEYEYMYTNGELDIDAIYGKTRRKRLFTGNVDAFEIMSRVDDKNYASSYTGVETYKNYGTGETTENTYQFITLYKGKRTTIVIDPNEKMLQAISTKLPRRRLIREGDVNEGTGKGRTGF